jgi:hypothetical protein
MTNRGRLELVCLCLALLVAGCQTNPGPTREERGGVVPSHRKFAPPQESRERILALDPEHLTEKDVREVLAEAPAPRIINIHGGILPLQGSLTSFSEFLVGMGYPRASIQNPRDGSYALGYYVNSKEISGVIAWYYEQEGMRPMIVGHSQGGIQAIKVLYCLADNSTKKIEVWNPLTWKSEKRYDFTDPLTGMRRPVVGLRIPYATAVVAGGLGRALPNQWQMNGKLRDIPDSVEEFTGFQKGMDILGGDFFGYGPANDYKPSGKAVVRNVRLPSTYAHSTIPSTSHFLENQQVMDWINNYQPGYQFVETPQLDFKYKSDTTRILWAADVWYSLKKHWVLELQQLLRAAPYP